MVKHPTLDLSPVLDLRVVNSAPTLKKKKVEHLIHPSKSPLSKER